MPPKPIKSTAVNSGPTSALAGGPSTLTGVKKTDSQRRKIRRKLTKKIRSLKTKRGRRKKNARSLLPEASRAPETQRGSKAQHGSKIYPDGAQHGPEAPHGSNAYPHGVQLAPEVQYVPEASNDLPDALKAAETLAWHITEEIQAWRQEQQTRSASCSNQWQAGRGRAWMPQDWQQDGNPHWEASKGYNNRVPLGRPMPRGNPGPSGGAQPPILLSARTLEQWDLTNGLNRIPPNDRRKGSWPSVPYSASLPDVRHPRIEYTVRHQAPLPQQSNWKR